MMITRGDKSILEDYVKEVEAQNYTMPCDKVLGVMSRLMDESMRRAFEEVNRELKETRQIKEAVIVLKNTPRTCKKFSPEKAILDNLTPYEQSTAIATWLEEQGPSMQEPHTLTLYSGDEIVPLWVKTPKNAPTSLTTIMIGTTRGKLKAPSYEDWANENPKGTIKEAFIEPLNGLEIQRQPNYIAALALKASAYDAGTLEHDWRYKVKNTQTNELAPEASVELKGQTTSRVKKIKEKAAGYNLASILKKDSKRNVNLLPELNYEDYTDEDYNDDNIPFISSKSIVKTFPQALKNNTEELDSLMKQLFVTRLGKSGIPQVKDHVVRTLFDEQD